jgi:hypothetical protein
MLKTAEAVRTQRSLLIVAMGKRPREAKVWRNPTRLSPPICIFCRSNPAAGTSLASRPCSVPTKHTWWPRALEFASDGEPRDYVPASTAASHQKIALLHEKVREIPFTAETQRS